MQKTYNIQLNKGLLSMITLPNHHDTDKDDIRAMHLSSSAKWVLMDLDMILQQRLLFDSKVCG